MKCVVSELFTHMLISSIFHYLQTHRVYLSAFLYIALLLENVISQHQVFGKKRILML